MTVHTYEEIGRSTGPSKVLCCGSAEDVSGRIEDRTDVRTVLKLEGVKGNAANPSIMNG